MIKLKKPHKKKAGSNVWHHRYTYFNKIWAKEPLGIGKQSPTRDEYGSLLEQRKDSAWRS